MFSWIRLKVKNAVLAGFADAVEVIERQEARTFAPDTDDPERLLEERLRLLPAAEAEEPRPKRGKASRHPGRSRPTAAPFGGATCAKF
jgi:hypothetical protein